MIASQRYYLYRIAADLLPLVLSGNADDSPLPGYTVIELSIQQHSLCDIEQRLRDWYQDLPPQIKRNDRTKASITDPLVNL